MKRRLNYLIGIKMKNQKGLTLIEILVVVGVFAGLTTLITGIFLANFEMQRRTMAIQKTIGEISYAVEYMGRAIRMARNDHEATCLEENEEGFTYGIPEEGNGIQFIDYQEECVKFFLDEDEGVIKKGIKDGDDWIEYNLTSGILRFEAFESDANVTPENEEDLYIEQPSATILLSVEALKGERSDSAWWDAEIQTTITRRRLDIERYHEE